MSEHINTGWTGCPPEEYRVQKEVFFLKSCASAEYRDGMLLFYIAWYVVCLLIIFYNWIKIVLARGSLRIKTYRDKALLVSMYLITLRIVDMVLMYIEYYGVFHYILTGYVISLTPVLASLVMGAWARTYLSLLLVKKKEMMRILRNTIIFFGVTLGIILPLVLACSLIPEDIIVRNIIVIVFFSLLGVYAIALCIIQIYIQRYLFKAMETNGMKEGDTLATVKKKLKFFTWFMIGICSFAILLTVSIIVWVCLTDFRGRGFIYFYIFGYFTAESFASLFVMWLTGRAEFNKGTTNSSGNTGSKSTSNRGTSTLESYGAELASVSKNENEPNSFQQEQ